ncbi:caspase family protein [Laspinema olomoucense]|uniref:caspase family protein n=1 Tax=Laspinema olomoucense TaxID=3231600 RepID=UPI0021BA6F29|nr:caspase family protein [Laspinema sp. D3d]MCT7975893.1 caspase family protein [Laspinema sp. D3d]
MSTSTYEPSEQQPHTRKFELELPTSYATYVDRWAIVVGISKYKYEADKLNLKYAHRDAEELVKVLQSPSGGGFEKDHIVKLVNEEATTANITKALRTFLKKPAKDDIVLIYFACHGTPDIDRPGIVYLLTHDTDPKDISGTALPMREIDLSLRENLLAKRVIILADTCHSAAIGGGMGRRDARDNSNVVNSYLREVSKAKQGIALLTSAETNEVSFEDAKWGGGHGVFTYYLLEGMKGAADRSPKNGIVTVGELFEYVRENVHIQTNNKQHPCIGTNSYDRDLPVAITAGISAQNHYELGCQFYQIGLELDDKYCFISASKHLREAVRLADVAENKLSEAYLYQGLALMAIDELSSAIKFFTKAQNADVQDAAYYLGIVYLKQAKTEKAVQAFKSFLPKQQDSDKAAYVRELISFSQSLKASKRYALLIGINYSGSIKCRLRGCVNDIQILSEVLFQKYDFQVKMLPDKEATYENIIKEFNKLQQEARPEDIVIIYYSGHENAGHWIPYDAPIEQIQNLSDADQEARIYNLIGIQELSKLIDLIPSVSKTLILDTVISQEWQEFIKEVKQMNSCNLLFAASPGHFAQELQTENRKYHGVFTYKLVQELWQSSEKATQGEILFCVKEEIKSQVQNQDPFFLVNQNTKIFCANFCSLRSTILEFSLRRNYSGLTPENLKKLYEKATQEITVSFPNFYYSIGLAFFKKGYFAQAITAFQITLKKTKYNLQKPLLALGSAQFNNKLYSDAIETFMRLQKYGLEYHNNAIKEVLSILKQIRNRPHYALLVGIENYTNDKIPLAEGATADVLQLKKILQNKFGFEKSNITVLLNENANRQSIVKAFQELVEKSLIHPALFYFSGNGSVDEQGNPTIVSADSQMPGIIDIRLDELSQLVNHLHTNLVSVIDADWQINRQKGSDKDKYYRYIPYIKNSFSSTRMAGFHGNRNTSLIESNKIRIPNIGSISIFPKQINGEITNNKNKERFTVFLLKQLEKIQPEQHTYKQLYEFLCDNNDKNLNYEYINIDELQSVIFNNDCTLKKLNKFITKIEQEPTVKATVILKRLINQRNNFAPEEYLNLGIAYYTLGEYDKSISALQMAIEQVLGPNSRLSEQSSTPEKHYSEAHYWLGRVLYESKRDPARAVSELRLATEQNPDNYAAHYYLGKALRALVEQKILTEAERAFQTYLQAGAPWGEEDKIQEFLNSRKSFEGK